MLIKRTTSLSLQGGEEVAPNKCNIRSNVAIIICSYKSKIEATWRIRIYSK